MINKIKEILSKNKPVPKPSAGGLHFKKPPIAPGRFDHFTAFDFEVYYIKKRMWHQLNTEAADDLLNRPVDQKIFKNITRRQLQKCMAKEKKTWT